MERSLAGRIRLIHIKETPEMDAANVKPANADAGVRKRLEFHSDTPLDSVRILVILSKAHDRRIPKEPATGNRSAGAESQRSSIRIGSAEHVVQSNGGNIRSTGEGKKPGFCI